MTGDAPLILHASCVAVGGRGLLILGPSGSGKSSLALQMMALGASLVADDRVEVSLVGGALVARCPAAIRGMIEARGIGLIRATPLDRADVHLAVDLGQSETRRLPEPHDIVLLGHSINLVHGPVSAHFPAALLFYLREGRAAWPKVDDD